MRVCPCAVRVYKSGLDWRVIQGRAGSGAAAVHGCTRSGLVTRESHILQLLCTCLEHVSTACVRHLLLRAPAVTPLVSTKLPKYCGTPTALTPLTQYHHSNIMTCCL